MVQRENSKKDSFFHNANSAINKKVWKKYPFDEKTKHIEDKIWGHQIIKNNYKIVYEPEASVFHWHGINQEMNKKRCDEIVKILENLDSDYRTKNFISPNKANIIAIVPHRGEILKFKNKPLIDMTLSSLKKCKSIKKIFVPIDNPKIRRHIEIEKNLQNYFKTKKFIEFLHKYYNIITICLKKN